MAVLILDMMSTVDQNQKMKWPPSHHCLWKFHTGHNLWDLHFKMKCEVQSIFFSQVRSHYLSSLVQGKPKTWNVIVVDCLISIQDKDNISILMHKLQTLCIFCKSLSNS
ncbi:hypothetical protein ILYODFUR_014322 [Ilyodon furcidens]|uniref:Uncharacterized protein n=1 Tax=Ilyodon furcidens TaxID=33524 RepID=A0ABV0VDW9_9TELE